jgi:raffinose synthase
MRIHSSLALWLCAALCAPAAFGAANRPASSAMNALDPAAVFENLSDAWSVDRAAPPAGVFLRATADAPNCYVEIPLGRIAGLKRFTSGYRFVPFWMKPAIGTRESEVQPETQWLLAETTSGDFLLLASLLDGATRFALQGSADGLVLVAETGDPAVMTRGGVGLFVARGDDPYTLADTAARAISEQLGAGRLRVDKPVPDFVNYFGWCTWDAFYKEVSPEKVRAGLASFAAGGVEPRTLILDDGWQSVREEPTGEVRLTSFAANDRFNHDLAPLVRTAKTEFKVRRFLVWHALLGYWGGVDEQALPAYGTRTVTRWFGPGVLRQGPTWNVLPWGAALGVPAADKAAAFFDDYHASLAAQGVDGVKVDNQAMLEAVSAGQGGRVALARAYRTALERSVQKHFAGRVINCMSATTEAAYLAADSTVMRTSDDFYPRRPEVHSAHVFINAHTSFWFGEFILPDWDMFQSEHPAGAFHAAARAISGGPVYVSDKPESHDFALLRKLVLSDGTVLRADQPGRPTRDCLFTDPRTQPVLLKVFNRNRDCGVVGLFNSQYHADTAKKTKLDGATSPRDVEGLAGAEFAAFAHHTDRVWRCTRDQPTPFSLGEGEWELVTYAPVEHAFAALGLADKFNSSAAITSRQWRGERECTIALRDGGTFVGWSAHAPDAAACDGTPLSIRHDSATGRLTIQVPVGGPHTLVLTWR